jgi:hypothetical protein
MLLMRMRLLSLLLLLGWLQISFSQENISWEELADVEWTEAYDTTVAISLLIADFGPNARKHSDSEVYISGYVIPLDALGIQFALSRTNYASCFFCGQAGPETVMDLMVAPGTIPVTKYNNTLLKFKGTLILKEVNPNGFNYQLINAELVK